MHWDSLQFDSGGATPIYRQLSDRLAGWIREGALADGSRLPPTRELAGRLGLNRTTVAAAYEALEQEGLLQAHVGRGSFVSAPARPAARLDWEARWKPSLAAPQTLAPAEAGALNFASWRPAAEPWAIERLRRAATEVLAARGPAILDLGPAEGYPPLRELLWAQMKREGIAQPGDELLITSGCQQGLDLAAKVLVGPGETVLLEDPVYPGARDLFRAAGAEVRGVEVGPGGVSMADLEQELARSRPRLMVLTPSFQNPTGASLSLDARREVLRLASRFQVPVVENDVYAGLRYKGNRTASLKELDTQGLVIHLRSFSKAAFPGLRVGWLVAPRAVARRLAAAKQLTDLHTDQLSQAVLARLAEDGTLAKRRERLRSAGAVRLEAALEAARRELPEGAGVWTPEGGAHLWVRLGEPSDASELALRARAHKLLFVPGRYFAVRRPQTSALRFTFAGAEPDEIRRGFEILGRLARARPSRAAAGTRHGIPALV